MTAWLALAIAGLVSAVVGNFARRSPRPSRVWLGGYLAATVLGTMLVLLVDRQPDIPADRFVIGVLIALVMYGVLPQLIFFSIGHTLRPWPATARRLRS